MPNHQLLWHGTKVENLMSILHKGLLLNVPYVEKSGSMFGQGLYFANVLDKSADYAPASMRRRFGRPQNSSKESHPRYLLLCDVALGESKVMKSNNKFFYGNDREKALDKKCQSIHAIGRNTPSLTGMVRSCKTGLSIPTGKIVPTNTSEAKERLHLNYDELVVYDSDRVAVQYVIRFKK